MGVGIELDTENSIRKYQVCKPVAPQQNRNRSASVAVFCCFRYMIVKLAPKYKKITDFRTSLAKKSMFRCQARRKKH